MEQDNLAEVSLEILKQLHRQEKAHHPPIIRYLRVEGEFCYIRRNYHTDDDFEIRTIGGSGAGFSVEYTETSALLKEVFADDPVAHVNFFRPLLVEGLIALFAKKVTMMYFSPGVLLPDLLLSGVLREWGGQIRGGEVSMDLRDNGHEPMISLLAGERSVQRYLDEFSKEQGASNSGCELIGLAESEGKCFWLTKEEMPLDRSFTFWAEDEDGTIGYAQLIFKFGGHVNVEWKGDALPAFVYLALIERILHFAVFSNAKFIECWFFDFESEDTAYPDLLATLESFGFKHVVIAPRKKMVIAL